MYQLYKIAPPFRISGIYSAYEFFWDSEMVFKGESHDFWETVTVLSGQVEVVEDDRYYVLDGGMTVCHAPGEFHRIRSAGGTSPHVLVLTFRHEGELPARLSDGVFILDSSAREELTELFYPLKEFYDDCRRRIKSGEGARGEGPAEVNAVLGLERFLLRLSGLEVTKGSSPASASAREYRALVRTMSESISEGTSIAELAERHHISESYVKKLFRTYAGEGAMSYYARLRVSEIKRLLDSGESVSAVAERLNFSSGAYLSTFFKKQTGLTPGEYAEKNSKKTCKKRNSVLK